MTLSALPVIPQSMFDADAHSRGATDRASVLVVGGSLVPMPVLVDLGEGVAIVTGTGPATIRPRVELHLPAPELPAAEAGSPALPVWVLSPDAAHMLGAALIEHASLAREGVEL